MKVSPNSIASVSQVRAQDKTTQEASQGVKFSDFLSQDSFESIKAVSYTHLTLPTTPYV